MIDINKIFSSMSLDKIDSPNKFSATWSVSPELPYFEGHFPENPILPAIALLDLSTELLKLVLKKSIKLKSSSSAKFLEQVKPHDVLAVELIFNQKSENWSCVFRNQNNVLVCKWSFRI